MGPWCGGFWLGVYQLGIEARSGVPEMCVLSGYANRFLDVQELIELFTEGVVLAGNRLMTEVTKRRILDIMSGALFSQHAILLRTSLTLGSGRELLFAVLPEVTSFVSLYLPLTKKLPFCRGFLLLASLPAQLLQSTR